MPPKKAPPHPPNARYKRKRNRGPQHPRLPPGSDAPARTSNTLGRQGQPPPLTGRGPGEGLPSGDGGPRVPGAQRRAPDVGAAGSSRRPPTTSGGVAREPENLEQRLRALIISNAGAQRGVNTTNPGWTTGILGQPYDPRAAAAGRGGGIPSGWPSHQGPGLMPSVPQGSFAGSVPHGGLQPRRHPAYPPGPTTYDAPATTLYGWQMPYSGPEHREGATPAPPHPGWERAKMQSDQLDRIARALVAAVAIDEHEARLKEFWRVLLECACRTAIVSWTLEHGGAEGFDPERVELRCFGSVATGFALKNSDLDLMLLSPTSQPRILSVASHLARVLEKDFLDYGWGAKLLAKTRVPVIKICEEPSAGLLQSLKRLRDERERGRDRDGDFELGAHLRDSGQSRAEQFTQHAAAIIDPSSSAEHAPLILSSADVEGLAQLYNEDLWHYYHRARNILRRLERRNCRFPVHQREDAAKQSLMRLTDAFIAGLGDETLKSRVLAHKSARPGSFARSFPDMLAQVGGEQVAMAWETRTLKEATNAKETDGMTLIRRWHELHDPSITDDAEYARSLQVIWHKLKLLPSATIRVITQRWDESPERYHTRCFALFKALGGRDFTPGLTTPPLTPREEDVLRIAVGRFISGMRDQEVLWQVRLYWQRSEGNFADLKKQFCAEVRIQDFKMGRSKGFYSAEEEKIVDEYAGLIRRHGTDSTIAEVVNATLKLNKLRSPVSAWSTGANHRNLEFPTSGAGQLCDITFPNSLALENTQLLRCYNLCDERVRPMVLCIKAWAKRRGINSPYHGTLSSYGYVLMALHYLINIADPAVLPNLQLIALNHPEPRKTFLNGCIIDLDGYDIRFWRNEEEIRESVRQGLSHNRESLGSLLRGFFDYYSHQGPRTISHGFNWVSDVVSIRTPNGLLSKESKGWTTARRTLRAPAQTGQEATRIQQRYLLSIEDPFEIDHNVGRTVTPRGLHDIRDEFRRAWKLIQDSGKDGVLGMEHLFLTADDSRQLARNSDPRTRPFNRAPGSHRT